MLASDDNLYVMKVQGNPQGSRTLVNEYLATRLASEIGLSVQPCATITVDPWLIDDTPELTQKTAQGTLKCAAGVHFASRFAGGLMPGQVLDYLPLSLLNRVKNLHEFSGVLLLDKWTCNVDARQAVFVRSSVGRQYKAIFIDQGHCFNGSEWLFHDIPTRGVFGLNEVYAGVTGWRSFEPWMERIQQMPLYLIRAIVDEIPSEWYGGRRDSVDFLVEALEMRKSKIPILITDFRDSYSRPFIHWRVPGKKAALASQLNHVPACSA